MGNFKNYNSKTIWNKIYDQTIITYSQTPKSCQLSGQSFPKYAGFISRENFFFYKLSNTFLFNKSKFSEFFFSSRRKLNIPTRICHLILSQQPFLSRSKAQVYRVLCRVFFFSLERHNSLLDLLDTLREPETQKKIWSDEFSELASLVCFPVLLAIQQIQLWLFSFSLNIGCFFKISRLNKKGVYHA